MHVLSMFISSPFKSTYIYIYICPNINNSLINPYAYPKNSWKWLGLISIHQNRIYHRKLAMASNILLLLLLHRAMRWVHLVMYKTRWLTQSIKSAYSCSTPSLHSIPLFLLFETSSIKCIDLWFRAIVIICVYNGS